MTDNPIPRVHVVDSHTGGEPTRVVISGGPELSGSVTEQLATLRSCHDDFRRAVVTEPRGSDILVGALLTRPNDVSCAAGVIFFNNIGYLGMCGHGAIGVVATLAYLGRLRCGEHRLATPVGAVTARLHSSGAVSIRNVPSYRYAKDVAIKLETAGPVTGDVAWGGNWFFLTGDHGLRIALDNTNALTAFAEQIRQALAREGVTGKDGALIDHIELYAPPDDPTVDSRNFVLCPGNAYDRSPCGTGTSARLACLYADQRISQGAVWRQQGITGSVFEGSVESAHGDVVPTITGTAHIIAEGHLLIDPADPFRHGIGIPGC